MLDDLRSGKQLEAKQEIYILDTSAIVQAPEVLAKASDTVKFVIPQAILGELTKYFSGSLRDQALLALQLAQNHGAELAARPRSQSLLTTTTLDLSRGDIEIAELARERTEEQGQFADVYVVTNDKELMAYMPSLGVSTIDVKQLVARLVEQPDVAEVRRSADKLTSSQRQRIVSSVAAGASIFAALVQLTEFLTRVGLPKPYLVVGLAVVAPLVAGVLLFAIRQRFRLTYGVAEVLAGVYAAYEALSRITDVNLLTIAGAFQVLGGLYIVVRGMDNIGKGLDKSRYGEVWKSLFGER